MPGPSLLRSQAALVEPRARVAGAAYEVAPRREWGWPELFIAGQVLWGVVLFLPGAQEHRTLIRAMPYLTSGAALAYYFGRPTGQPLPDSARWLMASLALLLPNLLHATAQPVAGAAQIVFQASIAAPALWMARAVRDERRLAGLVLVLFASSAVAATVGILQVYAPSRFLPPEFSVLALELNPGVVDALTYAGADGRPIVRPPGLSDVPGGASLAGMLTAILGLTLALQRGHAAWLRAACAGAAAVGLTVLFLTQVRALSLLAVAAAGVFAMLRWRQGRAIEGTATLVVAGGLVLGAFAWAVLVGGASVSERFIGLFETGLLRSFDEGRGGFVRYTLGELLFQFPFGAGLGRWGMMHVLFGDPALWQAPPIHVEIQPTGWLLDGGIPLLVLYVGALALALRQSYRVVTSAAGERLQGLAASALSVQVALVVLCLAGPVFNNQLGILFWSLTGALSGVATRGARG
jgi:hypothetical protein